MQQTKSLEEIWKIQTLVQNTIKKSNKPQPNLDLEKRIQLANKREEGC